MGFVELPDGARLRYDRTGAGPTVVLIHPGLWDRRTWDDQMASFAEAGFDVLRYDLRGYGESSRPAEAPYSHVRDLRALLDALDVPQAALIGCSMGGSVAIDATLELPERVWSLVAIASGLGGFEALEEEEDWWAERSAPIDAAIEAGDLERAEELRLEIWAPLGTDDEAGAKIRRIAFENIHELTMDESAAEELDPPAAHRLAEIDVPTLVIAAEHDPPVGRRMSELIARGVLDARLVTINADHVVNVRAPKEFDATVIPFLQEVAP